MPAKAGGTWTRAAAGSRSRLVWEEPPQRAQSH
jgi:hypothetical protein